MNKVTEANLIASREETAAMRNQVNTAKLLEGNPTLINRRMLFESIKCQAAFCTPAPP